MYLIDAHQDLAYNVLNFGRDYLRSAVETRRLERESGSQAPLHNGNTLLGWPDYQRARNAVIFATLFAAPERRRLGEWEHLSYRNPDQAYDLYQAQIDVYARWQDEHHDKFRLIRTAGDLGAVLAPWEADPEAQGLPVGLVILMEGAEAVRSVEELELWWGRGVRAIGLAWAGNRLCGGTMEPGPLTSAGFAFLDAMADLGFILDLSHMDEQAALQALDHYPGAIIATHGNAQALLKGAETNRHLSDRVIQGILERAGVIGVVPYNRFLKVGWELGDPRSDATLHDLADHIDHICQLAGSAAHAGFGTDFDGGFGVESTPAGLDTIADLHTIIPILRERGYGEVDIASIFGRNWQRLLAKNLPE